MKNFCPNCNRLTISILANPEVCEDPILDEANGGLEAQMDVSLLCEDCGHQFTAIIFKLDGMASEADEHHGQGHEFEVSYNNATLNQVGDIYALAVTVELRCSCQDDALPLETVECERTLTEEEIEEALA